MSTECKWCGYKHTLTMAQKMTLALINDGYKRYVANVVYKRIVDRLFALNLIDHALDLTGLGRACVYWTLANGISVKIVLRTCLRNKQHNRTDWK